MPYLQHEKARLQTEFQAAEAQFTNLTSQLQTQQQAAATSQSQLSAAQTRLAEAQAQIPGFEAAATAADNRVADLDQQILDASEPVQELPGRPGVINRARLAALRRQRAQAETEATAAHFRVNNANATVSQITAEVQANQQQVAATTATVQATQQAIVAAQQRRQTAQTEVAKLGQWNEEIVRDPLIRKTLEPLSAELSNRVAALEDAHAVARVQNEIAEETLLSLTGRRDQLTAALNTMNADLPALLEDLRVKQLALSSVTRRIQAHLKRGPRA